MCSETGPSSAIWMVEDRLNRTRKQWLHERPEVAYEVSIAVEEEVGIVVSSRSATAEMLAISKRNK